MICLRFIRTVPTGSFPPAGYYPSDTCLRSTIKTSAGTLRTQSGVPRSCNPPPLPIILNPRNRPGIRDKYMESVGSLGTEDCSCSRMAWAWLPRRSILLSVVSVRTKGESCWLWTERSALCHHFVYIPFQSSVVGISVSFPVALTDYPDKSSLRKKEIPVPEG